MSKKRQKLMDIALYFFQPFLKYKLFLQLLHMKDVKDTCLYILRLQTAKTRTFLFGKIFS